MRIHDCFCHHNHQTSARWKTLERKPILLQQTSKSLTLTFSKSWPVPFHFSSFIESLDPRRSFFRFSPSKPLLCVGFPTCQHTSRMVCAIHIRFWRGFAEIAQCWKFIQIVKMDFGVGGWGGGGMDKSQKSNLSFD